MAVNGLSGIGLGGAAGFPANAPRTGGLAGEQRAPDTTKPAVRPASSPSSPAAGVPAEAPAGTDPALWAVLTGEERAYFARFQSLGPLTYGRQTPAPTQAIARGGRLDVTA